MAIDADTPEDRLAAAGYSLPAPPKPVATYVTSVRTGKLGAELTLEQGVRSGEKVGLCMLATIKSAIGELRKVRRFVRVLGMVNAAPDFQDQPQVINGFSDLMVIAFGEGGRAARSAVGMQSLPSGIAVEIEATVELHDGA